MIQKLLAAIVLLSGTAVAKVFPSWAAPGDTVVVTSGNGSQAKIGRVNVMLRNSDDRPAQFILPVSVQQGLQTMIRQYPIGEIAVMPKSYRYRSVVIGTRNYGDIANLVNILNHFSNQDMQTHFGISSYPLESPNSPLVDLAQQLASELGGIKNSEQSEGWINSVLCGSKFYTLGSSKIPTGVKLELLRYARDKGNLLMAIDPTDDAHPPGSEDIIAFQAGSTSTKPDIKNPQANNIRALMITSLFDSMGNRRTSLTGKGITINIVDTANVGNSDNYKRLMGDYYGDDAAKNPVTGHGSVIGKIITEMKIAPSVNLRYKNACDKLGKCDAVKVVMAVCDAGVASKASVINLSLGTPLPLEILKGAVMDVTTKGHLISTSYGNASSSAIGANNLVRRCDKITLPDRCTHFPADWSDNDPLFLNNMQWPKIKGLYSVGAAPIWTASRVIFNRPAPSGASNPIWMPGEFWWPNSVGGRPYYGTSFSAPVWSAALALWLECKGKGRPTTIPNNPDLYTWLMKESCLK